jgi:hypothetical protein
MEMSMTRYQRLHRPKVESGYRRPLGLIGLAAVVVAAGLWFAWPRISVQASRTAMLRVSLSGIAVHLLSAGALTPDGGAVPLSLSNGRLWPAHRLAAGRSYRILLTAEGPFGWLITDTTTLKTPAVPHIASHRVAVPIGEAVTLHWSAPVDMVAIQQPRLAVKLPRPGTTVSIGRPLTSPGLSGSWSVTADARGWEIPQAVGTVTWHTVSWLTARTTVPAAPTLATSVLTVHWSSPLSRPNLAHWRMSPSVPGRWTQVSSSSFTFHPSGSGVAPGTAVTLSIPGGSTGPVSVAHAYLRHTLHVSWTTPQATTLRLQQWLAELGYLPVSWTPAPGSSQSLSWSSAYSPPAGSFSWRYPSVPAALAALWQPGQWNVMVQGAMMHFEHHAGIAQTSAPTAAVWRALRLAVLGHQVVTTGYSYTYVSETLPEQLWVWHDGRIVVHTLVNTGIPATPTYLGTYPVYQKLLNQTMRGVNPNGVPYADAVHWVNYFWGSNAVHGFVRASYGFPQSLGCVEVPLTVAAHIYAELPYGALVTVKPPGSGPL